MDILKQIAEHKKVEVNSRKEVFPIRFLEQSIYYDSEPISLSTYLKREDKWGIIAEFKRKSPSQGFINRFAQVEAVSLGYMQAGASALSILTDNEFFGGSLDDLKVARKFNYCPILRKEFIIDEYQVHESKSIGADAILLIAALLKEQELKRLSGLAHELGMEVLIEAHDKEEVNRAAGADPDLIGINNRDLRTFEVNLDTSRKLLEHIPSEVLKVSESGFREPADVAAIMGDGYDAVLIGQQFMETNQPARACQKFINELEKH